MVRETYSDAAVTKRLADVVAVKLNVATSETLMTEHRVESVPTVIYLGADGKERARFQGFRPPDQFLAFLDEAQKTDKTPAETKN